MPPELWKKIEVLSSNRNCKIVCITAAGPTYKSYEHSYRHQRLEIADIGDTLDGTFSTNPADRLNDQCLHFNLFPLSVGELQMISRSSRVQNITSVKIVNY